jgi:hypothetical protein
MLLGIFCSCKKYVALGISSIFDVSIKRQKFKKVEFGNQPNQDPNKFQKYVGFCLFGG